MSLTEDELNELLASATWQKVKAQIEVLKAAVMEDAFMNYVVVPDNVEQTAMNAAMATMEIRMYEKFLDLKTMLFPGWRTNDENRAEN